MPIFVHSLRLVSIKLLGRRKIPGSIRNKLLKESNSFNAFVRLKYNGQDYFPTVLTNALIQPFCDLLNRPAGGEAYYGGVVFNDPDSEPVLNHFRGNRRIDRALTTLLDDGIEVQYVNQRLFWCGPIAFHFGHQIADFGSRVLLSSIDIRDGQLLWYPWRAAERIEDLHEWQQFLLSYLNPGRKQHRICSTSIRVRELVVYPQQARMHSSPTNEHLEALCWCEKQLRAKYHKVVYISRAKFAPCDNSESLLGSFAGEEMLVKILSACGVTIIYPEDLSLEHQLEIYLGAEVLIFAEGSAQHGLELLGYHGDKRVFIICRRPQQKGMALPLESRFPKTIFIEAIKSQWKTAEVHSWNALAVLDWSHVVSIINPFLPRKITIRECEILTSFSTQQLSNLSKSLLLHRL